MCAGTVALTPDMALRLARLTGASAELLLTMQLQYSVWHGMRALRASLERILPARRRDVA